MEDKHAFVPTIGDVDVVFLVRAHSPRAAQLVIYETNRQVSVVDPALANQEVPFLPHGPIFIFNFMGFFIVVLWETLPKVQGLLTNDTAYAPDFFTW